MSLTTAARHNFASYSEADLPHPEEFPRADEKPLPLGERLVRAGLITHAELEAALHEQTTNGVRLGEALVELGFIDQEQLLPFIRRQLDVTAVRLRDGLVDPRVVRLLPRSKAEQFHALALFKVRGTLCVAMSEPQHLEHIDEIERITGCRVRPVFAFKDAIHRLIPRVYEENFEVDAITADLDQSAVELHAESLQLDLQNIEQLTDGSPIINLVNYIVVHAVRQKASDIHIEPGHRHTSIRLRVDGQLREILRPRKEIHPALVSRVKVMARMDIAEHREPQDGRMHVVVEGGEIDLRVSSLPTVVGEKIVLRVLDRRRLTFNLDHLGVPDDLLSDVKQMLGKPYGLVLVTGPTGSGKTTTLYSALELIKSVHRNIVTVEDPVEYQLDLINQVQVNPTANLSFARSLRAILRQDPDVIMVGEIRDAETAEVAIQAALTGHLVLSTLHTNDCATAVTRLIDMGVASFKIAAALQGVIAQRLLRTVCPRCRASYYPNAELLNFIQYAGDRRRQFVRGEGCAECYDTGFQGRTGIYEVLPLSGPLREILTHGSDADAIRRWCREHGGRTLLDEGIRLAETGRTSLDEVLRVANVE